jgi:Family of unknown function (DUF5947)
VTAGAVPRGPGALAVLRRIAEAPPAPAPAADERCEMCGEPVPGEHRHVVDLDTRRLLCTCRPCWLLFPEGAQQRYRAVPERHLSFPGLTLPPSQWEALEIPVGLAFFLRSSRLSRLVALYPGPAGATESELPLGAWDDVVAANPELAEPAADVEALFIRTDRPGPPVCWLVPVDRCYELVGRLRRVWRGFDGGTEARAELEAFTADITARSRPATGGGPWPS